MSRSRSVRRLAPGLVVFWLAACGGNDEGSTKSTAELCRQNCSLNQCPSDPSSTDCEATCADTMAECPTESRAAFECRLKLGEAGLECGSSGVTQAKDSTSCAAELQAAYACLAE
jgi:hypothetical protein